ncbi:unnamed protein product [Prunus armeniaca]|uniref:Cytochrome P450 n=1 Tax=Prunus armeniaca TaxID=36596 RepID=A0A6J5VDT8_PRUAR|nr:unnamed protein product [Prunus armeniaca]
MAITGATSAALAPPTSTPPPKSKPHSMSKMMMSNGYSSNFRKTHARKGGAQIPYGGEASDNEEAKKFIEIINEGFAFAHNGATHLENFLPILNWFSKEGYEKKLVRIAERVDRYLQGLVDEHRSNLEGGIRNSTIIDLIICFACKSHNLSITLTKSSKGLHWGGATFRPEVALAPPMFSKFSPIKAILNPGSVPVWYIYVILLMGRTDTSSITLEWAMFNVLNHPDILNKAKVEMNNLPGHGREQRLMDESDISKLPYLRSIISETLQLYPPGPLLAPHFSSGDYTIGGFDIARNTIL